MVSNGIEVVLFSNERHYNAPDAVFPNNWFSTHQAETTPNDRFRKTLSHHRCNSILIHNFDNGYFLLCVASTVVVYPMKAESRRAERREQYRPLQTIYFLFLLMNNVYFLLIIAF